MGKIIQVEPGRKTLSTAISSASDGDVIKLAPGKFYESDTVLLTKRIDIIGSGNDQTQLVFDALVTPVAFREEGKTFNITFDKFSIADSVALTVCNFKEPYGLDKNITIKLIAPNIRNNRVNIRTDLGVWYATRRIVDYIFGTCMWSRDSPEGTGIMEGGMISILTSSCRAMFTVSVKFNKLGDCGVVSEDTPNFSYYRTAVFVWIAEYVTMKSLNDTMLLDRPFTRQGIGMTALAMEIDRIESVSATITIIYPDAELEVSIVKIDVGAIDGWNKSTVTLQMTLPAPFTVPSEYTGVLSLLEMNDETSIPGPFVFSSQCEGLRQNDSCKQMIIYDIETCDMTGSYAMMQIPIVCSEIYETGEKPECPVITSKADVYFYINSNNFCEVLSLSIDALFQPTVELREDNSYNTTRNIETPFSLGDISYWAIQLWTNATGVTIVDSYVTQIVRTSNSDCANYSDYMKDLDVELTQKFTPNVGSSPPEIQMPIPVATEFSCASANKDYSFVTLNFTIVVDYLDDFGLESLRRRRTLAVQPYLDNTQNEQVGNYLTTPYPVSPTAQRRGVGEVSVVGSVGVRTEQRETYKNITKGNESSGISEDVGVRNNIQRRVKPELNAPITNTN
eukprot:CFRG6529T1